MIITYVLLRELICTVCVCTIESKSFIIQAHAHCTVCANVFAFLKMFSVSVSFSC